MNPLVIALVGRPNVGKSTLFNRLTRSRRALVMDMPGVTRDRQFGQGTWDDKPYIVIDTPGVVDKDGQELTQGCQKQTAHALDEADLVYFVVDAKAGLQPQDREFANQLRKTDKPVYVVANKTDHGDPSIVLSDFYRLGFKQCFAITATHNQGIGTLLDETLKDHVLPEKEAIRAYRDHDKSQGPKIAIIGQPNAGKSTLFNRMLGQDRSIVCDIAGTTRDSLYIPMTRFGQPYVLIDTAGVRRKKNVTELVEKFSIVKTLQAIEDAHVVLMVVDAQKGLTDQDLSLMDLTLEAGRGLIVCANKWDGLAQEDREQIKSQLKYRTKFVDFATVHYISAKHGTGVGNLFSEIDTVFESLMRPMSTNQLSKLLHDAIEAHAPPLINGRRIKLRYAHCGGHNPPTIVIHGNQTEDLPESYGRYLSHFYRDALELEGTPVKIIFKSGENPFAHKRNILTKRQIYKRQRLMKHVKKLKKRSKS